MGIAFRLHIRKQDSNNYVLSSSSHSWPHELHVQIFAWTETGSLSHGDHTSQTNYIPARFSLISQESPNPMPPRSVA